MIIAISKVNPRLMHDKPFKSALRLLIGAGCSKIVPLVKNMHVYAIEKITTSLINNLADGRIIVTPWLKGWVIVC